jgi:hypothetical protein
MSVDESTSITPSLKGISLQIAIDRLNRHVDSGKLTREKMEERLLPEDFEILGKRIAPTLWYPLANYERIVTLIQEVEGGVGDRFWVKFGEDTARETLGSKAIQVLIMGAKKFGDRAGIPLVKLGSLFFNFSEWQFEGDDLEHFTITISEAGPMPEIVRHAVQGFIQHIVEEFTGKPVNVTGERPRRDKIVFRA